MPEYIDREKIRLEVCSDCTRQIDLECQYEKPCGEPIAAFLNEDPPDVAPVVHGKWENNKNEYPECTNCGYMPAYDPAIDDINYSPYCPNCGAKMDGEEIEKQREELKKKEQIMRDAQLIARNLGFAIKAGDYRTALRVVKFFGRDENT